MTYVTNAAIFFKHPAYENEMEYRFLETFSVDTQPNINSRVRRNTLIRYRELDWKNVAPDALREIVVGPADQRNARHFADECMRLWNRNKNVTIIPSTIPYKG